MIERTYYCEGPNCAHGDDDTPSHSRTATPPPHLPVGFLEVRQGGAIPLEFHFCGWECAMQYGATLPPPEIIE